MALYRTNFKRMNFGINPPLCQSADVIVQTDIPFDDQNLEAFETAAWKALYAQNPHWQDASPPVGLSDGWSSVLGGDKYELITEDFRVFAWHSEQQAWLKADGHSTTEDVEEAGKFSREDVAALEKNYPQSGTRMLWTKRVTHTLDAQGKPVNPTRLAIQNDNWVLWGYGPRVEGEEQIAAAMVPLSKGGAHVHMFKLPGKSDAAGNEPQEYERKRAWAWRFEGEEWQLADSQEAAEAAAKDRALEEVRLFGHSNCRMWLGFKHNKIVSNLTT